MKVTKTLNRFEIQHLIADYFSLPISNISLTPYITTEGYGMMEETVADVRCEVTTLESFKDKKVSETCAE